MEFSKLQLQLHKHPQPEIIKEHVITFLKEETN